jgi:ABC-2 type transport system permease protein
MHNLLVLIRKEIQESVRDLRILWVPLVFICVGVMQPITMKMLPDILKKSAGSGITVDPNMLKQSGNQIFAGIFSQMDQFAIIVIALVLMSAIVKEKNDGTLDVLFSKPVTTGMYLASKFIPNALLMLVSAALGLLAGWYYTNIYFSNVTATQALQAIAVYLVWILFITFLSISASAICPKQLPAAAMSIGICIVMTLLDNLKNDTLNLFLPSTLSGHASELLMGKNWNSDWTLTIIITGVEIVLLILISFISMRRQRR